MSLLLEVPHFHQEGFIRAGTGQSGIKVYNFRGKCCCRVPALSVKFQSVKFIHEWCILFGHWECWEKGTFVLHHLQTGQDRESPAAGGFHTDLLSLVHCVFGVKHSLNIISFLLKGHSTDFNCEQCTVLTFSLCYKPDVWSFKDMALYPAESLYPSAFWES